MACISAKKPYVYMCVSSEKHQDGTDHIHVAVRFATKIDTRDPQYFDLVSLDDDPPRHFHGNYQAIRRWKHSVDYVKKDGEYTEWGMDEEEEGATTEEDDLAQVAKTMTEGEFANYCVRKKVSYQYFRYFWERTHNCDDTSITTDWQIPTGAVMSDELLNYELPQGYKSILLVGPTGIGKTLFACSRAPKPSLLISHLDQLKQLNSLHKSIIFDDMTFTHLPLQAQIHLVDSDLPRAIHRRYGTTTIPKNTIKFFTSNEPVFENHPAINRRITKINLYK